MGKNKNKSRKAPKQKAKVKGRTNNDLSRLPMALRRHVEMILDPCAAPLSPSVYNGPTGVVQRFVSTGTLTSTTQTAAALILVPGGFRTNSMTLALPSTTNTIGYGIADVPGYGWLQTNAYGARVLGACLQVHWNSSELNRAGSLACGVVPASTFTGGNTITVNDIYTSLPVKERIPSGTCEIIWNPGTTDAEYERCDAAISVPTFDDKNAIAMAFTGPSGFQLAYTYTLIVEWTPKPGIGQPAMTTVTNTVPDAISQVNNMLASVGFQNRPISSLARNAVRTFANYTGTGGAFKVLKTVTGAVNTLLP